MRRVSIAVGLVVGVLMSTGIAAAQDGQSADATAVDARVDQTPSAVSVNWVPDRRPYAWRPWTNRPRGTAYYPPASYAYRWNAPWRYDRYGYGDGYNHSNGRPSASRSRQNTWGTWVRPEQPRWAGASRYAQSNGRVYAVPYGWQVK